MPGSFSWMPSAPQGVKGFDDEIEMLVTKCCRGVMCKYYGSMACNRLVRVFRVR